MDGNIQVDYEVVEQIADVFADQFERMQSITRKLDTELHQIMLAGWTGEAADEFFADMQDDLMPAMLRLMKALDQASEVTKKLWLEFANAEEEAVQIVGAERGAAQPGNPAPAVPKQPTRANGGTYLIRPGDNLTSIARRYGVSVEDLVKANNIANPDLIYAGQTLVIPGAGDDTGGGGDGAGAATGSSGGSKKVTPIPGESGRTPQQYNRAINSYNVANNPAYLPRDGKTYCNVFAADFAKSLGAPLPLFVTDGNGNITRYLGATLMKDWLDGTLNVPGRYTQGPANGWIRVGPKRAAEAANDGFLTIAAGYGHMAVVRAGTPEGASAGDIRIAQAGASNFNDGTMSRGWGSHLGDADFYVYVGK